MWVSYLRKHGDYYTLDIFCSSGDKGRGKAEAAEKRLRRILEAMLEETEMDNAVRI